MTRRLVACFILMTAACSTTVDGPGDGPPDLSTLESAVRDRYIVTLVDGAISATSASRDLGVAYGFVPDRVYESAFSGFVFRGSPEQVAALRRNRSVLKIEPDRIVSLGDGPDFCQFVPDHPLCNGERPEFCDLIPDSPLCDGEDDPDEPDDPGDPDEPDDPGDPDEPDDPGDPGNQVVPPGITRVGGPVGPSGNIAWVIDTGIDFAHDDLNVDVALSRNFVTTEPNDGEDLNGHGTHVAGTIAAIDNDIDVVGVAAGSTVVAVRVLNSAGSGALSDVVAGIDYVAGNATAGDVANMSLSAPQKVAALDDAVRSAADGGILFALAAGNDAVDSSNVSPANVDHPNVFTVSAIGDDDCLAGFSNFGAPVDVTAPGVNVLSTANGGGTVTLSGTSMSTPHVAGILLGNGGVINPDGAACGDPDGSGDPIAHF